MYAEPTRGTSGLARCSFGVSLVYTNKVAQANGEDHDERENDTSGFPLALWMIILGILMIRRSLTPGKAPRTR